MTRTCDPYLAFLIGGCLFLLLRGGEPFVAQRKEGLRVTYLVIEVSRLYLLLALSASSVTALWNEYAHMTYLGCRFLLLPLLLLELLTFVSVLRCGYVQIIYLICTDSFLLRPLLQRELSMYVSTLQSKIATSDVPGAAAQPPLALVAKQVSVGESRTTYANVT